MSDAGDSALLYEVTHGVARLTMNRPERGNAATPELYSGIRTAVRLASEDPAVDIIVLTGAGDTFCAGGDLKVALSRFEESGIAAAYEYADSAPFAALQETPKTVIAAINGPCYAGGVILALYCDLSIARESAVFALTEARVGLADDYAPAALVSRVPMPVIKHLLFTGEAISARRAAEIGLIGEVVPDASFVDRLDDLIALVRSTSGAARGAYKAALNRMLPRADGTAAVDAFRSSAALEGLRAFDEKRRPDFRSV